MAILIIVIWQWWIKQTNIKTRPNKDQCLIFTKNYKKKPPWVSGYPNFQQWSMFLKFPLVLKNCIWSKSIAIMIILMPDRVGIKTNIWLDLVNYLLYSCKIDTDTKVLFKLQAWITNTKKLFERISSSQVVSFVYNTCISGFLGTYTPGLFID